MRLDRHVVDLKVGPQQGLGSRGRTLMRLGVIAADIGEIAGGTGAHGGPRTARGRAVNGGESDRAVVGGDPGKALRERAVVVARSAGIVKQSRGRDTGVRVAR